MENTICVVLPAAGVGERMGIHNPKQFCKVLGKPVISHTISAFERIPWVQHIIVPVSAESHQLMTDICRQHGHTKVIVTPGAATRHKSIYNGVKVAEKEPHCDVVVIHDGVRPFVETDLVEQLVKAAYEFGAAGVVRPLISTVVQHGADGMLEQSLDRTLYRASEMPQAFLLQAISKAYSKCTDYDFNHGTECLHLAQKYAGVKVKLLDGPDYLWKVTHKKDLYALEGVLKDQQSICTVQLTGFHDNPALLTRIQEDLEEEAITFTVQTTDQTLAAKNSLSLRRTVIYHSNSNPDSLLSHCKQLQLCENGLKCLIILMNTQTGDVPASHQVLWDIIESIITNSTPDTTKLNMIYGILLKKNDTKRVSHLLIHLLRNSDTALCGQVFVA